MRIEFTCGDLAKLVLERIRVQHPELPNDETVTLINQWILPGVSEGDVTDRVLLVTDVFVGKKG